MSRRLRFSLAFISLLLILLAVLAIGYAAWPLETIQRQAPLAPTLFVSP